MLLLGQTSQVPVGQRKGSSVGLICKDMCSHYRWVPWCNHRQLYQQQPSLTVCKQSRYPPSILFSQEPSSDSWSSRAGLPDHQLLGWATSSVQRGPGSGAAGRRVGAVQELLIRRIQSPEHPPPPEFVFPFGSLSIF